MKNLYEIKNKIITNENIKENELETFIKYINNITDEVLQYTNKKYDYSKINLANEILWSHNINSNMYKEKNHYYCIFEINNKNFIYDPSFKDNKITKLKENKYIEYDKYYKEYLKIIRGV